jgi:hypothetical protein
MYGTTQLPNKATRNARRKEIHKVIEEEIKPMRAIQNGSRKVIVYARGSERNSETPATAVRKPLPHRKMDSDRLEDVFIDIDDKVEDLKCYIRWAFYGTKDHRNSMLYTIESKATLLERNGHDREFIIDKVARRLISFGGIDNFDSSKGTLQTYVNRQINICLDRMINSAVGYRR